VVSQTLGVDPGRVVFVDDRQVNVDGAVAAGMRGVRFQGALQLEAALKQLGLEM
jgi:putative hydrolase of the HAD superfamily